MTAYYNENDTKAAAWLKELIAQGHVAPGEVDERSIEDVRPDELMGYTQCHFFAGIGGWSYALRLAGWPDDRPVWTGSCPCQPFSAAGSRKGIDDERHLWPAFRWLIDQCRPVTIFGEQVASKDGREWFSGVRSDLDLLGYDTGATDLCAAGVGAPHKRQRIFWVGVAAGKRLQGQQSTRPAEGAVKRACAVGGVESITGADGKTRRIESGLSPLVDGIPARVVRLRGYGNAIVPQVAAEFVRAAI